MTDRFLIVERVMEVTSLGKTLIWAMVKDGSFPKPRQLSARRVAWLESEVVDWMHERPASEDELPGEQAA